MNNLHVGFSRANVNPPIGIEISGYYKERFAEGILDDLEVNAVAISQGNKKFIIFSLDSCNLSTPVSNMIRKYVADNSNFPYDSIMIHTTHSHTTPYVRNDEKYPFEVEYLKFLKTRFRDCAINAERDMKDAKMGIGFGKAENISFLRRFRMKDGSVATNPGPNNPDIVAPIGIVDETVNVIRFDRENAESIIVVNFGTHPDVIGGNYISADWPGFTRRYVEKAIDNTKCIMLNGVQGDVNHVNVHPKGGDFNDLFVDFDDVSRGYQHAKYMGRVVAGAVMCTFDKVEYLKNTDVDFVAKEIKVPYNKATKEELVLAHKYNDLHIAGKDEQIPFKAMALTTVVAEAQRMVRLENAPEFFTMNVVSAKVGDVAFFGIPGEPFTGIGLELKKANGYKMVCPMCLTNGCDGYFPMQEAYDEGGYEARSSQFKAGTAEIIASEGKKIIESLKK